MKRILLLKSNIETVKVASHHPVNYRPPYPLKYIQALLKDNDNFMVDFIDAYAQSCSLSRVIKDTLSFSPDIVIISSTPLDTQFTAEYIRTIKQSNNDLISFIIGPGPSSVPQIYNDNCPADFILPGEPELEIFSILTRTTQGEPISDILKEYQQLDKSNPFIVHIPEDLPFIDYNDKEISMYGMIYPLKIYKKLRWGHILTSRGCPYGCIFCSPLMRDSYGKSLRRRSAENIVDELEYQRLRGINIVSFDDDNFTTSKEHIFSVCNEIKKRRIVFHWIAHTRLDNLDYKTLEIMKDAGCCLLRIGVESGSERIINILRKTGETGWEAKAENVFAAARRLKIDTAALFIIGNPTETKEEIAQSIRLAIKLKPQILQVSFFTPFPGSAIYQEMGLELKPRDLSCNYHYSHNRLINLSNVSDKGLVGMHKLFYIKFLFSRGFIFKHIIRYLFFYLFNFDTLFYLLNARKFIFETGRQSNGYSASERKSVRQGI